MIDRVRIQNFRCLRNVELRLSPLTVLVGPNASGKSSVLRALAEPVYRDVWMRDPSLEIQIDCWFGERIHSHVINSSEGYFTGPFGKVKLLRLNLDSLRSPNTLSQAVDLDPAGGNLVNVFATLPRRTQEEVAQALGASVPTVSDVIARPLQAGMHRLVFQDRWNREVWYEPGDVSDGTMLLLAFLTLQFQQPPYDLILIEEPERGLHPYLIRNLVQFLRRLTTGEIGSRPTQIILATHSSDLLDSIQPDEVRFMVRDAKDGSVRVEEVPTAAQDWVRVYREYDESLGRIWLSGSLGGVPGE